MITRKGWRTSPVVDIARQTHEIDPFDIAANMERHLQERLDKSAVQTNSNLYEQITSIINGVKPKFSCVEEAVKDMQERSGFASYQIEKNNFANMQQKQAQNVEQSNDKQPHLFTEHPEIKETFDNYINDTHGNVSVPAVLDKVKNLHKFEVDNEEWNDDDLLAYVDKKCNDVKESNPTPDSQGLGKLTHFNDTSDVDPSNRDAFFSLTPNKSASIKTAAKQSGLLGRLAVFDTPKKQIE